MTATLLPLLLTAAGLLVVSGVAKLRDPAPAAAAVGVPAALVRGGALVELAVAVLAVVRPAPGAAAAAALYAGFAALVTRQLRRGATRSCGCLGSAEAPPSRLHVALDLAFALVCTACVVVPPRPLGALPHVSGLVVWLAGAVAARALAAALELVPAALASYRRPAA